VLNIIPSPKIAEKAGGKFYNGRFSACCLAMPTQEKRIDYLINRIWADIKLEKSLCDKGYALILGESKEYTVPEKYKSIILDKKQSYYIKLDEQGAFIFSNSIEGLFYGIQTLKQIVENNDDIDAYEIVDYPDIESRGMYIDLRQTFPKFELLLSYIEMMAEFKTNKLVIEYEDKFPFEKYAFLRHGEFCLTDEQLAEILETAERNFIEVIPLQQSYGHLEYVLKHPQFKNLRETPDAPGEMCSCKSEAIELAKELIDEVINKHPNCGYIHLGCDEVWSLCTCGECKNRFNGSKEKLFISYVNQLIEYVCSKGKKPIIWNDMLAKCSAEELSELDNRVAVMIWLYRSTGIRKNIASLTAMLKKYNIEVIGGSAVRCNDGDNLQNYPKTADRMRNIDLWTDESLESGISFMVSTNWATAFAMGAPYGIFETSIYPMYYSGERYWNNSADKNTFLNRFFRVFHGFDFEAFLASKDKHNENGYYSWDVVELDDCTIADYYKLLPTVLDEVVKHKDFACFMKTICELETALRLFRGLNAFSYRAEMFGDSEAEITSLRTRGKRTINNLFALKQPLYDSLLNFLPPQMAQIYVNSRFFVPEYMYENFYKRLFII